MPARRRSATAAACPKLDPRIAAYGTVDELNAQLGVVLAGECPEPLREMLLRVQNELFDLGADLCVPPAVPGRLRIEQAAVDALEADCDRLNEGLSASSAASFCPVARRPRPACTSRAPCVAAPSARRSRRRAKHDVDPLCAVYLNRLSDLLFIAARASNAVAGEDEPLWKPGGSR